MFAFLKTILGGRKAAPQQAAGLATPRTAYTPPTRPGPARPAAPPPRPQPKRAVAPVPQPVPVPAHDAPDVSGSDVDIPLSSVLRGLPPDLKDRVRDLDIRGATMTISLERILAQLPSGSVRISFGSLRQAAPQLFSIGAESDERDVALPLDEILSRINPAIICPPQNQIARAPIAEEPAFSSETYRPAQTPARNSTLSVPRTPAPSEVVDDAPPTPSARRANRPTDSAAKSEMDGIPDLFFDGRKGEASKPNGDYAEAPTQPRSKVSPKVAATPAASSPAFQPSQAQPAVAVQPAHEAAVMRIPLKDLTELWPEELRSEIARLEPAHIVALPAEAINAALKQGKVVFPWGTLRSWITPQLSVSFRNDTAALELPLPIIMPVFLAGRKQPSRQQVVLDDDIPDPFADFIEPPSTAKKNGNAEPEPARAEKAAETKPVRTEKAPDTKAFARNRNQAASSSKVEAKVEPQPESAQASLKQSSTPAEVLASAVKLDGVVGALVALADGFKVASKLPAGLDGDAVAAFLPHIFSKVNQSTRELRMGELDNLNFTVDNVPWKIFRVNQLFFAALGKAGEQMPTDQLAALAHQLTFKN